MAVLTLGISFRRAPIDLLERLAFAEDDLVKVYRRVQDVDDVEEAVVLSTCNRVELYGVVPSYHAGFLTLKRLLAETRGVAEADIADGLYAHWERDAVEHLFSVAGGLDSMVLGETQIQSQVREALRLAEGEGAAGSRMQALFHAASRAGRRIRQETSLGAAPDAFVDARRRARGRGARRPVRAVGRGDRRRHDGLPRREAPPQARGGEVRILNRSLPHARALAERSQAEPGDLASLSDALRGADLVVSATGATGVVVHVEQRPCGSVELMHLRSCCSTWPCRATSSPRPAHSRA